MRLYLIAILLLTFSFLKAQVAISGKVEDNLSKGITNVSITYKAIGKTAILGYAISKENGNFQLNIKSADLDSMELIFSHLAYQKMTIKVANKTANYIFKLTESDNLLKEVNVAAPPIFKRGDTLSYHVNEFTSKQDRVIADVIKKLPGVEINGNIILYQGKPIQKYMVNNLDLMGGKYGMINNNLPADAVKDVQIIENDQPIKILDSLVSSDRASLNIKLKKFTTTGSGKLAAGYKPGIWDVNLTPMSFNKGFQMLNSFQSNNSGNDVSSQLGSLYMGGMSGPIDVSDAVSSNGPSFFSFSEVSSPDFSQRKWLDNRIFLYSTNLLKKLASGLEIRGNASYYNNLVKREGFSTTSIFTPDQTIDYTETVNNRYETNDLDVGLNINKNEKNVYLKNSTKFHRRWNDDLGNLLLNDSQPVIQHNNFDDYSLLNKFSIAHFIGKQLISINSLIDYGKTPQELYISPGQFVDIFNKGNQFDAVTQRVQYSNFKTENDLSFTRRFHKLIFSPKVGINYSNNQLNSQILTQIDGEEHKLGNEFGNSLNTEETNLYLDLTTRFEINDWKFTLNTPYGFNVYRIKQLNTILLDNQARNTFGPSLSASYKITAKTDLTASTSYSNSYGGLSNFNNAYILRSYRYIEKFNGRLQEDKNFGTNLYLSYKNTAKSRFANLSYRYSHGQRDYIFRTIIDDLGLSTLELEGRNSSQNSHTFNGGASTYFSKLKTVVKVNANVGFSGSDYLLNDLFTRQTAQNFSAGLDINNNSFDFFALKYNTNISKSIIKLGGKYQNDIVVNNHTIDMSFYPIANHSISINNSYYLTNIKSQKNQVFIDLEYRWTIPKFKTDIEFNFINLLNNKLYIQQFNAEYSVIESYFQLRPRRFMISTKFRF